MLITLTTDFGQADSYVGVMKGVILGICPEAKIVDITHGIPAQDLLAGAIAIEQAAPYFPPGTVHVVVIDPGVGSSRHPVAVATPRAHFVGPDNGVFSLALADQPTWHAVRLSEPAFWLPNVSTTFHGRDIFAPVAAHIASGTKLDRLGTTLSKLVGLNVPTATRYENRVEGEVLTVDRFGNCVCNITAAHLTDLGNPTPQVRAAGQDFGQLHHTFADVAEGALVSYIGSDGRLELAIRNGNAAKALGIERGTTVAVIG